MAQFIAKVMLQDVTKEEIYTELDKAMGDEEGYPYITDKDERIFALPPDEYEFETDLNPTQLLTIIKNICANIEKKHKLKKTPIVLVEAKSVHYTNLEELSDEDFAD